MRSSSETALPHIEPTKEFTLAQGAAGAV
jgi:hypothetical protein